MLHELHWGLPVIGYLFLAGVGAGALTTSGAVLLRGGGSGFGASHFNVARYGAFIAPLPVAIGTGLLVLELGSFEVGNWFKFLNLFKVVNLSPMSIGSWLLVVFLGVSVLYAYTFWGKDAAPDDRNAGLRRTLAWISIPLGLAAAIYTGVLLGAMPSRPFWNSPVLALLFMLSSMSTGIAAILLARVLFAPKTGETAEQGEPSYFLTVSDTLFIGLELIVIFLFLMFAHLTVGDVKTAISVVLFGGSLAMLFWVGVVLIGLVFPALIEFAQVAPRLLHQKAIAHNRALELVVPVAILVGGFLLRYVVVVAGQVTGPVGI